MLDGSGGVGSTNWWKTLQFVSSVVEQLDVSQSATRVGVVVFANNAYVKIALNDCDSRSELLQALADLKNEFPGGASNTAKGILTMDQNLFTGDRNVPYVGILMTDAESNRDSHLVEDYARQAQKRIHIMAVGTTDSVELDELKDIASDDKDVLVIDAFDELPNIKNRVVRFILEHSNGEFEKQFFAQMIDANIVRNP